MSNDARIVDRIAIEAVIGKYIAGLRQGSVDLLKQTFHKHAIMYGFSIKGMIHEGGIQRLYDIIETGGPLSKVTGRVSVQHQTSNTASVLAELASTAENENSTDYLSLMKIDGKWIIISKVYHLYDSRTGK